MRLSRGLQLFKRNRKLKPQRFRRFLTETPTVLKGKVAFFNFKRGFGFIEEETSKKGYFVHLSGLKSEKPLYKDSIVSFSVEPGLKGEKAVNVVVEIEGPKPPVHEPKKIIPKPNPNQKVEIKKSVPTPPKSGIQYKVFNLGDEVHIIIKPGTNK